MLLLVQVVLTAAFPNSGYLPLLLLPAMCRLHPAFRDDPGAADRSIGYVSGAAGWGQQCLLRSHLVDFFFGET